MYRVVLSGKVSNNWHRCVPVLRASIYSDFLCTPAELFCSNELFWFVFTCKALHTRSEICLISAEGADFHSKEKEVARRTRGLCKSAGLHAKDKEKGTLHGIRFKLLQTRLLSFTFFHFRISPNTFHMSARSKPYPPETKAEEIDLAHLYELWSKYVFECFWCYALRSLEWELLFDMRHTRLPLDTTHVDVWVKQAAFIIYLKSCRSSEATPAQKQRLSQHMANIFHSICAVSLLLIAMLFGLEIAK